MTKQERTHLCKTEAARAIRGYLKTGLASRKQQAIDRLNSIDYPIDADLTVTLIALEKELYGAEDLCIP